MFERINLSRGDNSTTGGATANECGRGGLRVQRVLDQVNVGTDLAQVDQFFVVCFSLIALLHQLLPIYSHSLRQLIELSLQGRNKLVAVLFLLLLKKG